jgi:O-antigen/teichoic acid export membrane protein
MASAVVLLPFYVLYLPGEVYGTLALIMAASMLVQLLVGFSFDSTIYLHYYEWVNQPERIAAFMRSASVLILLSGAVVLIILVFTGEHLIQLFFSRQSFSFYPYGVLAAGMGIFQAIFKLYSSLLIIREKAETHFWSNLVFFIITTGGTVMGLYLFPNTLAGPVGARFTGALLLAGWSILRLAGEFGFSFSGVFNAIPWKFNLHTFFYNLSFWMVNYLDRFVIAAFLPVSAVGTYEFAIKCLIPLELLLNGLHASISPRVVRIVAEQPPSSRGATPELNRYFYGLVGVQMLAIGFILAILPLVFTELIRREGYAEASHYLPYLAPLYIFRALRLYVVLPMSVLKQTGRLALIGLLAAGVKTVIMVGLIPQVQLYGVMIGAAIAAVAEILLIAAELHKSFDIRFNAFKLVVFPLVFGLAVVAAAPLSDLPTAWLTYSGVTAFAVLLLILAYRHELPGLLEKLMRSFSKDPG